MWKSLLRKRRPSPSDNRTFNTFWDGATLSASANVCLNSFGRRGFAVNLYAYDRIAGVPAFVTMRDAAEIMPRDKLFYTREGVQHFSDVFRYFLLEKHGGWWIDTDIICNTGQVRDTELVFARLADGRFANGQLKFPKHHPVLKALIRDLSKTDVHSEYGATGPDAMTAVLSRYPRYKAEEWPKDDLYPIDVIEAFKFLLPEFKAEVVARTRNAPFVHLYTSILRPVGLDERTAMPPVGSYLHQLYLDHGDAEVLGRLVETDVRAVRSELRKVFQADWFRKGLAAAGFPMQISAFPRG